MMEVLAIIPARGGSKGLPNKNILSLIGHPLIAYSIKAANDSKLVTRTIVTTDSDEIAAIALQYGAEVPFLRPANLAEDHSTDLEVFDHTLKWLKENENYVPDLVIQLRPTSPVRQAKMIDNCIRKLINHPEADSLRIVTPTPLTPYKMWKVISEELPLVPLLKIDGIKEPYNEPRQRLPVTYWQIGTLDVIRPDIITRKKSMSGNKIIPYIVDNIFAVDIDEIESFTKAADIISNFECVKF